MEFRGKRPFQIHLATALALVITCSVVLYLNIAEGCGIPVGQGKGQVMPGANIPQVENYGFPFVIADNFQRQDSIKLNSSWPIILIANFTICFGLLYFVYWILERVVRDEATQRDAPGSPDPERGEE